MHDEVGDVGEHGLAAQRRRHVEAHPLPPVHERDVGAAGGHLGHGIPRLDLVHDDVEVRGAIAQRGQHAGHDAAHGRRERREAQQPRRATALRLQARAQPLDLLAEHASLVDEPSAGGREHHAPAGPLEQGRADLPLEALDLLRHGGGCEAELGGRAPDAPAPLDGDEGLHRRQVDHAAMLPESVHEAIAGASRWGRARIDRVPRRHAALAVLVAVVWGANFVVIDLGIGDVPPDALRRRAVRRRARAGALRSSPGPGCRGGTWSPSGLCMSLGQFALLYTALAVGMPAGLASLVLQAQVVLTVLLAALTLRERPSRVAGGGVVVGAVGSRRRGVRPLRGDPGPRARARRGGRDLVGARERRRTTGVGPVHPHSGGRAGVGRTGGRAVDDRLVGDRRAGPAVRCSPWSSTARTRSLAP